MWVCTSWAPGDALNNGSLKAIHFVKILDGESPVEPTLQQQLTQLVDTRIEKFAGGECLAERDPSWKCATAEYLPVEALPFQDRLSVLRNDSRVRYVLVEVDASVLDERIVTCLGTVSPLRAGRFQDYLAKYPR